MIYYSCNYVIIIIYRMNIIRAAFNLESNQLDDDYDDDRVTSETNDEKDDDVMF
jgi:hypothetical protein